MTVDISITRLTAEHYEPGAAVGHASPRLSWRFGGGAVNWTQAGYDLRVTRPSGTKTFSVESPDSILVPWPDVPLESREKTVVEVRAHGTDRSVTAWAELKVEAALLNAGDWTAKAISSEPQPLDVPKRPFLVRKRFSLASIGAARLYITALGVYEATINGKRVSDHVLAPGWQSYTYRHAYQTLDVTDLLKKGDNEVSAWVGEGWWAGRLGFGGGTRNIWGSSPALIAQLEVDGRAVVQTDGSWEWATGPLPLSEIYDGESVDTAEPLSAWKAVTVMDRPSVPLVSPQAPPVRRTHELKAVEIITTPSGKTIIDFGQNLVGWVRWNKQIDGTGTVSIYHAEVLENGELGTRPLRACKATDHIKLGGTTLGYEPKFTFHGFRYAQVDGFPRDVQIDDFTAVVIFSDMERTGEFKCSHKGINQLHSNVVWGLRGNFVSVPTDCPQRDERLGWTADLMAFAPAASYIYNTSGLITEWLGDVAAEQLDYGQGRPPFVVPNVPTRRFGFRDRPKPTAVWSDATTITPVDMYHHNGDLNLLREQYASMTAWIAAIPRVQSGLWKRVFQFGDWLDPRAPPDAPADGMTDPTLVADIYLINTIRLAAKVAGLLGHTRDAAQYDAEAVKLLDAFHDEYVTPNGRITSDSQCAYVCSLWFDLYKTEKQRDRWVDRLVYLVRKARFRVGTGFASTPFILLVLAKYRPQAAYRMLQEEECPSWLYQVNMGATTMWERWDSMLPNGQINPGEMTSFNHYAFGSVAAFLHRVIGGLDAVEPGWKVISVNPRPGGDITHASASFLSPSGLVSCDWRLSADRSKLSATVVVPPNTIAHVRVGSTAKTVGSGRWEVEGDWVEDEVPEEISLNSARGYGEEEEEL
ncbi:hypothetical protein VHUM_04079 [Vanrija humicola]|uniref:alpha-L-rhamnosidase n=1 Tax=Vanrija humicola TaxID=5417 RepID=A0A7D8V2J0_VANHU|nr:hypothetical protein VHUM_04079 [Vanrija humicola]